MKKFWNFVKNEAGDGELTLYGEISDVSWWGDEITPQQFKRDLDDLGDVSNLNIYINSPGGDVFAGQTIYSILKRSKARKTVYIDGLAASIASIVAMAGDEVVMPKNAMMMIHNAWTITSGNKDDLRNMADTLEKIDGVLAGVYVEKSGRELEEVQEKMNAETWMTADEAFEFGLVDRVNEEIKVAASLDKKFLNQYHNIPEDMPIHEDLEIFADGEVAEVLSVPYNGEATQPVEENISPAEESWADSQRREFDRIKRKLLGKE